MKYVEIDGYGKVPLDEQFIIYDNVSDVKTHNYDEIIVGYSLQRFIVAKWKGMWSDYWRRIKA